MKWKDTKRIFRRTTFLVLLLFMVVVTIKSALSFSDEPLNIQIKNIGLEHIELEWDNVNYTKSDDEYIQMFTYKTNTTGVAIGIPLILTAYNISFNQSNYTSNFNYNGLYATVLKTGFYKMDYSLSFSGGGSSEYEAGVLVNNKEKESCSSFRKLGASGDVGNTGGTCILSINQSDDISLYIADEEAPAQNIFVKSANLVMMEIK